MRQLEEEGEGERGNGKEEEVGRINVREENNVTASASPMHNYK